MKKILKTPTFKTALAQKKTLKKASSLKKVATKMIKKSPAKKVKQMGIKASAKKTLEGAVTFLELVFNLPVHKV